MQKYSKTRVNTAGITLKENLPVSAIEITKAEDVLTYWRFIHLPVLNTFQATLRTKLAKKYKRNGFIAQRLKRAPSIISKLRREPRMKLSTMQDIAGIRAVMNRLKDVKKLSTELKDSKAKHKLLSEADYINNPKKSGYRSIHLIFEYHNKATPESDGLKIEVQLRTKLQHIWATSVETMGTFMDTSLKSSEGPESILNFFSITSSAFAILEKTPIVPEHSLMSEKEIFQKAISQYDTLRIKEKLAAFTIATGHIDELNRQSRSKYYLIILDLKNKRIRFNPFSARQLSEANQSYTEVERSISAGAELQAVLVSIDKVSALSKAYPNYFLDTDDFTKKIEEIRKRI
ncbi:MAG: RelA/SpoT domain-containing protein [Chitinophagaceae bacterium]|nr:RelA/SpoT domain-containing protein [Chitinophagaceae bacterium]